MDKVLGFVKNAWTGYVDLVYDHPTFFAIALPVAIVVTAIFF